MEVCRGIWKLMEASTECIRASGNCRKQCEASTSTDSGSLHVFLWKLPLTSMEENLLPPTSMETS